MSYKGRHLILTLFAVVAIGLLWYGRSKDHRVEPVLMRPVKRVPVVGLTFPSSNPSRIPLRTVRAFPHLRFRTPVFVTAAPDSNNRLFVLEKEGRIKVFPNTDEARKAKVFLDISAKVESTGESGFLGLAFDPAFAQNRRFYIYYTAPAPRRGVLASYTVMADDPNLADGSSERVLLTVRKTTDIHCGGMLQFGPDGMLYVSIGDGEDNPVDRNEYRKAQDLRSLLGKVLRIDPSGPDPYAIPKDNPFVGRQDGTREEIWAYGLRNPWRFSIDPQTNLMWVADVGRNIVEEINLVPRGGNMGWSAYEGRQPFNVDKKLGTDQFVAPLLELARPFSGAAVIGGYVYRGQRLSSMRGAYLYGDHAVSKVWAVRYDGEKVASPVEVAVVDRICSFGLDGEGELYAVSVNGTIHRFEEAENTESSEGFPKRLSETGLFQNTAALVPAEGLIPYDVVSPLWSDGALKRRWIALPAKARIGFDAQEAWTFPVGTVLVKHFEMAMTQDDPLRRLETRVLIHEKTGWAGYTYRWNKEETDAVLQLNPTTEELTIKDRSVAEGVRRQNYYYPSAIDCMRCHTEAAGYVLGVRTHQLNFEAVYQDGRDNQLRVWNTLELFSEDIGSPQQYKAMVDPSDRRQPLGRRARSYLAANCSQCHQPGDPMHLNMDLRFSTPTAKTNLFDVAAAIPRGTELFLIRRHDRLQSAVWRRMGARNTRRMPPLSTQRVDPLTHSLIGRWIDAGAN